MENMYKVEFEGLKAIHMMAFSSKEAVNYCIEYLVAWGYFDPSKKMLKLR